MFSVNLHEFKPIQALDCINLNMIIHKYELLPGLIGAVKCDLYPNYLSLYPNDLAMYPNNSGIFIEDDLEQF